MYGKNAFQIMIEEGKIPMKEVNRFSDHEDAIWNEALDRSVLIINAVDARGGTFDDALQIIEDHKR